MKQAVITTVRCLIAVSLAVNSSLAGSFEKGVKVGMSISNLRGDDVGISDYKTGFAAGGFATYLLNENLAVQLEALFVMKGGIQESSFLDSGSVSLSYLEVPLLLRVVFPIKPKKPDKPSYYATDKGLRPGFYAGPAIAYSLTDDLKVGVWPDPVSVPAKTIDFAVAFGGGFDMEVGKGMLAFDARYTLGVKRIVAMDWDADVRNGAATLMVGYVFR
ncbi:MAG: PorT family protein [Candidatus Zixiibacteriota bacterium]|nr:MAG: PorT family protein [candidate division Zixibacteria bacterium]